MATKRKHDEFLTDLKSLLDTGKFSDFTITCQGRKWKVHKAIVCSQSEVLEAASRFGKEATENKIDLPEDDPEIVEYILRFMYERNYKLPSEDIPGPHSIFRDYLDETWSAQYRVNVQRSRECVWMHSHKILQLLRDAHPHLLEYCDGRVLDCGLAPRPQQAQLNEAIKSVITPLYEPKDRVFRNDGCLPVGAGDLTIHAKVYSMAEKYFVKGLKETSRERFEDCMRNFFAGSTFYEAVEVVFTTTPDTDTGLRDLVAKRISEEKTKYTMEASSDMNQALREIPELAFWVMRYEDKLYQDTGAEAKA